MSKETEANVDTVRQVFALVETRGRPEEVAKRWATYVSCFDPDVEISEAPTLPYGGDYKGPGALERHAQAYSRAWQSLQTDAERKLEPRFVGHGDSVVVMWRQRGHDRRTGDVFDMPVVSTYEMRKGRVLKFRMFHFDAKMVASFLAKARAVDE